jgi:hypothetical protein
VIHFEIHHTRPRLLAIVALLLLPAAVDAAVDEEERRGHTLWVSLEYTSLYPVGAYDPIGKGAHMGVGIHVTLSRPGSALAWRLDFGSVGRSADFNDTTATYVDGTPWPFGAVPVSVGNEMEWFMVGAQWDPHPDQSGFYGFLCMGGLFLTGDTEVSQPPFNDVVIHDAPTISTEGEPFGVTLGVGSRLAFGKHRTHALDFELQFTQGGTSDYIANPPTISGIGDTQFPTGHANIAGWGVRFGYAHAFRWGKYPHTRSW